MSDRIEEKLESKINLELIKKQKSKSWLHIDQNPNNNIYSIQGSYNFMPVNNDDAGFICIPKSHITFSPKIKHKNEHNRREENHANYS